MTFCVQRLHSGTVERELYLHYSEFQSGRQIIVTSTIMDNKLFKDCICGRNRARREPLIFGFARTGGASCPEAGVRHRDARRRRIPVAILAQLASISRTTLNKLEKGDPGVSLGSYASGADDAIQSVENKNATATP